MKSELKKTTLFLLHRWKYLAFLIICASLAAVNLAEPSLRKWLVSFPLLALYYIASYFTGRVILTGVILFENNPVLEKICRILTGFGYISLSMFLIAETGLVAHLPAAYIIPAAPIIVYFLFRRIKAGRNASTEIKNVGESKTGFKECLSLVPLIIIGVAVLVFAPIPEAFHDSLLYHLALPQQVMVQGELIPMSHNFTNFLPLAGEMLYIPLAAGDYGCRLFQFSLSIMLIIFISFASGRNRSKIAAPIALGMFAYFYYIFGSITTLVEINVALYGFAGWLLMKQYLDKNKIRYPIMGGIMLGFACAVKYQGLLLLMVISVAFALSALFRKIKLRRILIALFIFSLAALVLFAPWMIRSALLTGNPVFPAFPSLFPSKNIAASDVERIVTIWSKSPWKVEGIGILPSFKSIIEPGGLGFFLFIFLISLVSIRRKWKETAPLLAGFTIYYIFWYLMAPHPRYIIPALPLLMAAAIPCAEQLIKRKITGIVLITGYIILFALNFIPVWVELNGMLRPFEFYSSGFDKQEYFNKIPASPYQAIEFLNRNTEPGKKVLFIGESRGYNLLRPYHASSPYEKQYISELLDKATSPADLRFLVIEGGFSYILINNTEWYRTAVKMKIEPMNFAPRGSKKYKMLDAFLLSCRLIYKDSNCIVLQI